jgi:hypothetical protein
MCVLQSKTGSSTVHVRVLETILWVRTRQLEQLLFAGVERAIVGLSLGALAILLPS